MTASQSPPNSTSAILPGRPYPLGATVTPEGVNFAVFSKNCTAVELLLFDRVDQAQPSQVFLLDPSTNRSFYYWHALLPWVQAGQLYGYRVRGPSQPETGLMFDGAKVLLDPYTRAVMYDASYDREAAFRAGDNTAQSLKSVVVDPHNYDWEGDAPLRRPLAETVIYELHVRGFTQHSSSGVSDTRRGSYAGLIEKISYLQQLGVTAVEFLPVQQFDETMLESQHRDYWGYNPIAFFAPHRGYSSRQSPHAPVNEFRDLVKELHRAGIEVILDVVLNHTAEGNEHGPTLCFRGLENRAYYIPQAGRAGYANYSGCGNTLNGNQSIVRRMIMDCLRYWVEEMHVDGFRFDLASVLARDEAGQPLLNPPILWEIESDPVLANVKIIAEAWDAHGLYQVGRFIGHRWAEWNGEFRDVVRRFVRGDPGQVGRLAACILGNPDLYLDPQRKPERSINYICCHDGFTLRDLVSYNDKHNEANGEHNRDGSDANWSWNCGVEGESAVEDVASLRLRQMKNLLTILMLSQGTPMLLMGDEIGRTQQGNNNAYCQDNETSWLDWTLQDRFSGLHRFVRGLIHLRKELAVFWAQRWATDASSPAPYFVWHGVQPGQPDWSESSHSLAYSVIAPQGQEAIHVILNAYWEPLRFTLPAPPADRKWRRVIDTALPASADLIEAGKESPAADTAYLMRPRSVVVFRAG